MMTWIKRAAVGLALALLPGLSPAQWMNQARQTSVITNNLQAVPVTSTTAQVVFDWIDDNWYHAASVITLSTNGFSQIGPLATNTVQAGLDKVDDLVEGLTTNVNNLTTNVNNLLQSWTNDSFQVLPNTTNTLVGLWPYMTNVDAAFQSLTNALSRTVERAPWASFVYITSAATAQELAVGDGQVVITTNGGTSVAYSHATNGITRTLTGSDQYWTVGTSGVYLVNMTLGATVFGPYDSGAASLDSWVTCNGAATPITKARTLMQTYQVSNSTAHAYGYWWKGGGSAWLRLDAGDALRIEAAVSGTTVSGRVQYVSFDIRRIGLE